MLRLVVLSALVAVAYSMPQTLLPAGLSAAECPNYPFCGPTPVAVAPVAQVSRFPSFKESLDVKNHL